MNRHLTLALALALCLVGLPIPANAQNDQIPISIEVRASSADYISDGTRCSIYSEAGLVGRINITDPSTGDFLFSAKLEYGIETDSEAGRFCAVTLTPKLDLLDNYQISISPYVERTVARAALSTGTLIIDFSGAQPTPVPPTPEPTPTAIAIDTDSDTWEVEAFFGDYASSDFMAWVDALPETCDVEMYIDGTGTFQSFVAYYRCL